MTGFHRLAKAAGMALVMLAVSAAPAAAQSTAKTVRPGAPGEPSRILSPEEVRRRERVRLTEADIRFMQEMMPHHAQALVMTALVPTRTENQAVHLVAQRIEVTQGDEIAWMRRWLEEREQEVPDLDAHHGHGAGHLMPGMLTQEEMKQLSDATGAEFDRLFLHYMIRHHEGALVMVNDLLASNGAAQVPDVFRFASDVDVDQRSEIARMRALLRDAPPPAATPASSHHH